MNSEIDRLADGLVVMVKDTMSRCTAIFGSPWSKAGHVGRLRLTGLVFGMYLFWIELLITEERNEIQRDNIVRLIHVITCKKLLTRPFEDLDDLQKQDWESLVVIVNDAKGLFIDQLISPPENSQRVSLSETWAVEVPLFIDEFVALVEATLREDYSSVKSDTEQMRELSSAFAEPARSGHLPSAIDVVASKY